MFFRHTSVVVYGYEYFWSSDVERTKPVNFTLVIVYRESQALEFLTERLRLDILLLASLFLRLLYIK